MVSAARYCGYLSSFRWMDAIFPSMVGLPVTAAAIWSMPAIRRSVVIVWNVTAARSRNSSK